MPEAAPGDTCRVHVVGSSLCRASRLHPESFAWPELMRSSASTDASCEVRTYVVPERAPMEQWLRAAASADQAKPDVVVLAPGGDLPSAGEQHAPKARLRRLAGAAQYGVDAHRKSLVSLLDCVHHARHLVLIDIPYVGGADEEESVWWPRQQAILGVLVDRPDVGLIQASDLPRGAFLDSGQGLSPLGHQLLAGAVTTYLRRSGLQRGEHDAMPTGAALTRRPVREPTSPADPDDVALHSMELFSDLIVAALRLAGARSVVEIGGETGRGTAALAKYASGVPQGTVDVVEPTPSSELTAIVDASPHVTLHEGVSPAALTSLAPADAYVLDGDHNYWTVTRELELIFKDGAGPLAILHDVGWPCARRDFYYDPARLPEDALHDLSWEHGVFPGNPYAQLDRGFRGRGAFAVALHEGGERNGVLTAVEDFLSERDDLVFLSIPTGFGLGMLCPASAAYGDALAELVDSWRTPLSQTLEENRLRLYTELIATGDALREVLPVARAADARARAAALRVSAPGVRKRLLDEADVRAAAARLTRSALTRIARVLAQRR